MKKFLYIFIIALISIITFSIIVNPRDFFNNVIITLEIWLYKVYPSIFTFYIMASLLINTKLINKFIYLFRSLLKKLKFSNEHSLYLFFLSIFTSNPSSSSLICDAYEKGKISKNEANDLLKYASFLGPLFILSYVLGFNIKYAVIVILVHVLSNFLICLYTNRKNKKTEIRNSSLEFSLDQFLFSINKAISLLLMISGVMVFAGIFRHSIVTTLNFFHIKHLIIDLTLANIEISLGLNTALTLGFSDHLTLLIMSMLCGFGGLSVHMQVLNVISKYKLSYKTYFTHRLIQSILSGILFLIFISF